MVSKKLAPPSSTTRPARFTLETMILLLFFGSGASALVYEVVWSRELTFVFGGSAFAIATVLAAYMAGLALGSAWFGRRIDRRGHPLTVYGVLEAAIGLWAVALPFLLKGTTGVYTWLYQTLDLGYYPLSLIRFALCFLLLLVPTTMMGGTLPVLGKLLLRDPEGLGAKAGLLYAVNTVGAVAGVALAGFVLIPGLGLSGATWTAVTVNLAIAATAVIAARFVPYRTRTASEEGPAAAEAANPNPPRVRNAVLWVYAASGFAALVYEVAWTKSLALVLGTTNYAFTSMLATFLLGLSLGAYLFGKLADRTGRPVALLAVIQIAIPLFSVLTIPMLVRLPSIFVANFDAVRDSWVAMELLKTLLAATTMFVPTLFMGGTFPLVTRVYVDQRNLGRSLGKLYAFNTVGAILGSFLAGFLLIPLVGRQNTILVGTLVNFGAAIYLLTVVRWSGFPVWTRWVTAAILLLMLPAGALGFQRWDPRIMSSGAYYYAGRYREAGSILAEMENMALLFYEESTEATISIWQAGHSRSFRVNGKIDASSHGDMITQKFAGHLPMFYHGGAVDDAVMIGLASGATAGALLTHPIDSLEAVEIIEAVPRATRYFADYNNHCLDDPRMEVIINDGRNHLLMTPRKYDVISSEPPNPWVSGVGSLFTRQFYRIERERMAPGGIACQWVQIYHMRAVDIKAILATFTDEFPYAHLWRGTLGDLLLIGSFEPLRLDPALLEERLAGLPGEDLARIDVDSLPALLAFFITDRDGIREFVEGFDLRVTDDNLYLEYAIPRHIFDTKGLIRSAELETHMKSPVTVLDPRPGTDLAARIEAHQASQQLAARVHARMELPAGIDSDFEAWQTALDRAPDEVITRSAYSRRINEMGIEALGKENTMEAERLFRIAARMGTRAERAIALSNLGLISFNRSETDSARHHWVRAKELEPNSPTLLYNLGVLASREEDYAAAAEQFRLALDVDPMNTDVMRSLAFARARHGEGLDEAEELARKASKRDPSFESRRVLGYVLAKHEKFDEAAALLKDLVREQPGNMWVTLHLARAEIGRGNSSEAQRLLSRVVDGSTDRDMTEEARSLLQSL